MSSIGDNESLVQNAIPDNTGNSDLLASQSISKPLTQGDDHSTPEKTLLDSVQKTEPTVKVCMLRSASTFTIPVRVSEHKINAVVDSGAQVTIISDRVFSQLRRPPPKLRDVKLDTAGTKLSMMGFVAGPIKLKIGETYYSGPIYVAPIEQDMLFGFDLLTRGSAILNMGKGTLMYDASCPLNLFAIIHLLLMVRSQIVCSLFFPYSHPMFA